MGTLWLLHYQLVKEVDGKNTEATAWWYFFNEFKLVEFTREDFLSQMNKYLRSKDEGEKPVRTIEEDFNCKAQVQVRRLLVQVDNGGEDVVFNL